MLYTTQSTHSRAKQSRNLFVSNSKSVKSEKVIQTGERYSPLKDKELRQDSSRMMVPLETGSTLMSGKQSLEHEILNEDLPQLQMFSQPAKRPRRKVKKTKFISLVGNAMKIQPKDY